MKLLKSIVIISFCFGLAFSDSEVDLGQVVFSILSQPHPFHAKLGDETKVRLVEKLRSDDVINPQVYTLHEDLPLHGGWTIFPLLPTLNKLASKETKWFAFLSESTDVNLDLFKTILVKYKSDYEIFIGHALKDRESVIIHHFDSSGLAYPDFKAGFLLSKKLVNTLATLMEDDPEALTNFPKDFSIDASHELSKVISKLHDNGPRLDHEPLLCQKPGPKCATNPTTPKCSSTPESIKELAKETLFAVKTCQKNHESRLSIVMDTWGPAAYNLMLISEAEDKTYNTVIIPGAETNTERGHCQKTEAIIHYFDKNANQNKWKWLVIADDDTMLGVAKVLDLLHCYDNHNDMVALGQRYGFRVARGTYGYDYQTGGSGMIFNRKTVEKMLKLSETHCKCHVPDTPDDMHLGACMANMGLTMTHCEGLHQARAEDYSPTLLDHQNPVSFHKFWNTDPRKIYDKWFREADEDLKKMKQAAVVSHPHEEL